ncbi:hypothetical protein DICTH_0236 [Dictyoglomus thermophilum H-6-12]|uniref:Uncharacterized protein n=1 Tax=Dictyoglomus thermophilum (strain ATCC 35947 / DSM 3960 / H-6-12) TaxID=309799 RepID=B5YC11_DICT6|nr:hypothetical protein DICTH_0236 [Dictyoglomus thermophilum H-6-12]
MVLIISGALIGFLEIFNFKGRKEGKRILPIFAKQVIEGLIWKKYEYYHNT